MISTTSSRACAGEGRAQPRQVRPRLRARISRGSRAWPTAVAIPDDWLTQARRAALQRGGEGADRGDGRLREAAGDVAPAPRRAEGPPRGRQQMDRHRRHLALRRATATTPKACASARRKAATAAPSRSGTSASSAISTTRSSSARATSSSRCAACASSRARARPKSSISTTRSASTAKNAGWLDLNLVPERHNAVKVLLLLDIGGSMDGHVRTCEELFSAARARVQASRTFLFPQLPLRACCGRTRVAAMSSARRRWRCCTRFDQGYKLILVGDATMAPYEIAERRRQRRALERRDRRDLAAPPAHDLSQGGVAQPRAGALLARHARRSP